MSLVDAEGAEQGEFLRAVDGGHLGSKRLGELYGETADTTGGGVDQDVLAEIRGFLSAGASDRLSRRPSV